MSGISPNPYTEAAAVHVKAITYLYSVFMWANYFHSM